MSTRLNTTPTVIAVALAALLAAGCASQSTADNASADNAAAGQSDVVSQSNPLDQPVERTTDVMLPSTQTAQTAPYSDTTTAATATQPADSSMASTTTDTTTPAAPIPDDTNRWAPGSANTGYTTDQPLPPRRDRN
ncbi:MAG: hypothetical protein ACT6S0_26885 [Roseateles sp.]|uniref:hypothetical protein n=1 Tax=Roseateles sp. TaxID=1971397 RepID=UPI004035C5C5